MRILQQTDDALPADRGAVLAIGNFDGVHRGHQAVFAATIAQARRAGVPAGVVLFNPHPRQYFQPDQPHFTLTPMPLRLRLLAALGLDLAIVLPFGSALASLSADEFIDTILVRGLGASHVHVGYNFNFGRGRHGSAATLAAAGQRLGFGVTVVAAEAGADAGPAFSSSRIRDCLRQGDMPGAANQLGYWWRVSGTVVGGAKRGSDLGFPTANIELAGGQAFKHGIYATRVWIKGRRYDAASYLGTRPTFDGGKPILETFLFDFTEDIYGEVLDVELIQFLRDDAAFTTIEALKEQMYADCQAARTVLMGIPAEEAQWISQLGVTRTDWMDTSEKSL
jgi:riboflavin kinase / FMN adenylyltransferase